MSHFSSLSLLWKMINSFKWAQDAYLEEFLTKKIELFEVILISEFRILFKFNLLSLKIKEWNYY